ncbi:DUF1330 domain-containing protein [Mucilaginibacter sp. HC2]|uniref:DUF1330 domain-containing protein n=1 Tax=Mucilaginibacter inviolabilis TaxID=2714892 RepID=UPI0014084DFC|nr:DUF1330 domain-containing protein [Mucilaginibacter inviolabilis]NHA04518.1 DUF1330 domain-containing protein [Mucilaginibacter inviolabilis]
MLYFTQIVFIRDNKEYEFNLFESYVLPLLHKHGGELIYRVRPTADCVIETSLGNPYEIHIVTFASQQGFDGYLNDEERVKHMQLKENAIEKVLLIAGSLL